MTQKINTHDLWQQELAEIDRLKAEQPELFNTARHDDYQAVLKHIGISRLPQDLPDGYYRLYPQDFIVEEISPTGELCTINHEESDDITGEDKRTIYCQLVKIGLYTLEAVERLAQSLNIDKNKIGYAGIKDAVALTSQRISLRGVSFESLKKISVPGIYLKKFAYDKGVVSIGQLKGNRFTIFVRTKAPLTKEWLDEKLDQIADKGFLNYYGFQRFGSRFSAHRFGQKLLQENYIGALRCYLTGTNDYEPKHISLVRQECQNLFDRGNEMLAKMKRFPYTLRSEIQLLEYLKEQPTDPVGAIRSLADQTRLWAYAYASYLFNKKVSQLAASGDQLPASLPLVLSANPEDRKIYKDFLAEDKIQDPLKAVEPFNRIRPVKREIPVVIKPKFHAYLKTNEGVVISFTLPKACYATTLLMNIFKLITGQPIPDWVKTNERDILADVKLGSVESIKKILGKYIYSQLNKADSPSEEIE